MPDKARLSASLTQVALARHLGAPDLASRSRFDEFWRSSLQLETIPLKQLPAVPTILTRSNGQGSWYPGSTHALVGENEATKSWIVNGN